MLQAEHTAARLWLDRHGLADAEPTPLLAARLAARWQAKLAGGLLVAVFLIGVGLTRKLGQPTDAASSPPPLLVPAALVAGLLTAQWLLGRWVRRADRRAGAHLSRRAALPVELGWPAVLGRSHALFTAATFAAALLLTVSVLPASDPGLRYGAIIVLIGLVGAGAGIVMQLRQVLTGPAVAQDQASLTADVVMRVEDARDLVTPGLVWYLPAIFLYGESPGWWNAASIALVVAGAAGFVLIRIRGTGAGTVARQAMATR
ncbi:hypothetical protein [Rhizohabitans arisaemae]|uniref:hypothetical protein n=1 Tax=Rhizohabitans arisaemae TaxID=2720610 RepID=UPI0024B15187|nr:hypothetical protein [Rhizohabitans arisaemae]